MATSTVLAACLMLASQTYSVPPAVLVGIYKVEGGKVGQEVRNTNGSYDLGPMQINTLWIPELAGNVALGRILRLYTSPRDRSKTFAWDRDYIVFGASSRAKYSISAAFDR